MACGTLAGGIRGEPGTLVERAQVCQGDKGEKGTLGSRNNVAAQGHGSTGELKIIRGGWNI